MIANALRARGDVDNHNNEGELVSESSRRRLPPHVRTWLADELATAKTAADPWSHLERAHIVSQPWAWPHTRTHFHMLKVAAKRRDRRELVGQTIRLIVAGPGSLTGRYPIGNTGRTTMRLTEVANVPDDLAEILQAEQR